MKKIVSNPDLYLFSEAKEFFRLFLWISEYIFPVRIWVYTDDVPDMSRVF
jgi:hypothetical protein